MFNIECSPAGMNDDEVELLYSLIMAHHSSIPICVVELGCGHGYSTLHIGYALKNRSGHGKLYTCDIIDHYVDIVKAKIFPHGLADFVEVHCCKSIELEPPSLVHFLAIDGDHTFPSVYAELTYFWDKLAPNALIFVHDFFHVGVTNAVKLFSLEKRIPYVTIQSAWGIALLQKKCLVVSTTNPKVLSKQQKKEKGEEE